MDRKQLKHWRARQRAWVEDARYLRFKAGRVDNPELIAKLMFRTAQALVKASKAMNEVILAESAEDVQGPGNVEVIPAEEETDVT